MMFVGVDGCRAGWFAVALGEDDDWDMDVFPDMSGLWDELSDSCLILLDIPIGLKERETRERLCDVEARRLLGPKRGSSVFPVPCRPSIYGPTYEEAGEINEMMTGRRLSLQTWNIVPKIREVDALLRNSKTARSCIRETHPEVCFWAMAGHPMRHNKKTKEGFSERFEVLRSVHPLTTEIARQAFSSYRRKDVARDDILDALSAAVTAVAGEKNLSSIPETPEVDSKGLPMEIVYHPHFKTPPKP